MFVSLFGGLVMDEGFITVDELAKRLRLKPCTVRRWANKGFIPAVRITPKVLRFDAADVERALMEHAEKRAARREGKDNG